MERYEWLHLAASLNGLFFVSALGAIVGSFINVLVYRLPRGLNVVTPPSACPWCETKLSWRDNVPIFGWLCLRGRCRYCKSRISPEYPLVELAVAVLFGATFVLWFMHPQTTELIGYGDAARRAWAPEWTHWNGVGVFTRVWPVYLVVLTMIAGLVAITLIDAKTFTIPLEIVWVMVGVAFAGHLAAALWVEFGGSGGLRWSPHTWALPTAEGALLGAGLCGMLGVLVSAALLRLGLLPRSFADYDEWERGAIAKRDEVSTPAAPDDSGGVADAGGPDRHGMAARGAPRADSGDAAPESDDTGPSRASRDDVGGLLVRTVLLTGPALALMFFGFVLGSSRGVAVEGMAIGAVVGLAGGVVLRNLAVRGEAGDADAADLAGGEAGSASMWVQYPHARREVAKEVVFCLPTVALAAFGYWLASAGGPLGEAFALIRSAETGAELGAPPLWLRVVGGVCVGYLVGGALVWAVRVLGTLAFGKEAMGLGDVHLMAAVGACVGWIDPTVAFFVAPFFGIAWAIGSVFLSRVFRREGMALPFGPHLAAATLLVVLAKPVVEWGLGQLWSTPIDLP